MFDESFIRNLGIIIIAAAVFALAARGVKLPTIVAYLAAGLAVGPITGLIEFSDALQLISDIGIVLLLFLVGLELSFEKIRDVGRVAVVAGMCQVLITAAGGFALARWLDFGFVEALFLATALTFSSTVVVVKLLEEKKEFDTLYARIAIGILLVQDLVVIVLLTFLAGLPSGESIQVAAMIQNLAKAFAGMGALLTVVLLASRYWLPRPFAWAARSPETLFIWSLCWCFFIVLGAHFFHLSHETGAFLAGLSLAQLPYNQDLRRRVHPLMNFFIAVFFVSLGIKMDLGAAATQWGAALLLSAFVLGGKCLIILFIIARLGYSARTANLTGITLAQVSEFSFILTATGVKAGLVGPGLLSLVGLVGLITISLSSCMIIYNRALHRWMSDRGLLRFLSDLGRKGEPPHHEPQQDHIIVVGMNTMGRDLVARLHARGEHVLAVDTDPAKLSGLPAPTLLGNVEYLSVLEEAGLPRAKLLVSALRIEDTNDLLAYRCKQFSVPCSIHVIDMSLTDNLLEMDATYLMISKVDGIKLQNRKLKEMGVLTQ